MEVMTWIGIGLCISQSAIFSGLNLAMFGITRLRLEVEVESGNTAAIRVQALRTDANFLLTTILWGNVAYNTLLAILSNSVMTGLVAFLFSTFLITFVGEIVPQAYFSRHALRMASMLAPLLHFYQHLLYPVAKPSAKLLDWWLGAEGIRYFREEQLREVIRMHIEAADVDVDRLEGLGALNFLAFDDLPVTDEGVVVDPRSIITLPSRDGRLTFPEISRTPADPFLRKIQASGKKWVIIVDETGLPRGVLDADGFLRSTMFEAEAADPRRYCHHPIVVHDAQTTLGNVIWRLRFDPEKTGDEIIDRDVILIWGAENRIITGADMLGRLLRGIVAPRGPLD